LGASLERVNFQTVNLWKANLEGANLEGVHGLIIEQLYRVKSLYEAKLDPELMEQVKEKYPHFLEEPG
jgi:BTB/POZ domain-containing protein KCTD9